MNKELSVVEQYGFFASRSEELAVRDVEVGFAFDNPRKDQRSRTDARERHLLGMIEMYSVRYGDFNQRRCIVDFIEDELFSSESGGEVVLSFGQWTDLRKRVVAGEYIRDG